ncbi:MAG: hypothetical protein H0X17_21920, partial [Deltaproteobacteria bacterium]|nr:hypothetical protein [Deltaproteobacteria bacterium]
SYTGNAGEDALDSGGGGGGVGWIRVTTFNGMVSLSNNGFTSPRFGDAGSPASRASAVVE